MKSSDSFSWKTEIFPENTHESGDFNLHSTGEDEDLISKRCHNHVRN